MYYIYNTTRKQYITSVVSRNKNGGGYALYYGDGPVGCRWATERAANKCIERIIDSTPDDEDLIAVYVPEKKV